MLSGGPDQQAGVRLSASAMFRTIVRAHVDARNAHALAGKVLPHRVVDVFQIGSSYLAKGDASLVCHDDDLESCLAKGSDGGETSAR
jgi:hypothetical protein